jgi:hypothetical protein
MKNNKKENIYLSGSIEFSLDAFSWRNELEQALSEKYNVIIPIAKDTKISKYSPKYKEWVYKYFIRPDIDDVIESKYFFVKIDKAVLRGAGTISETTVAAYYNKNIVYWITNCLKETELPGWLLGSLHRGTKVKSIGEAVRYYNKEHNRLCRIKQRLARYMLAR